MFRWKVREAFRAVRVRIARINAYLQENVVGMKVVQLFTREQRNFRDFDAMNADHRDAWLQSIRYDSALFAVVEFASGITIALVIWQGAGYAAAGTIYVFIDWMRRFFLPLRDLSAKYSVMQSSMASAERIFQLLDTAPAVLDPPAASAAVAARAERRGPGRVRPRLVLVPRRRGLGAARRVVPRRARAERRARRRDRRGQDDDHQAADAPLRRRPRRDPDRRRRPARVAAERAAPARRDGAPGRVPVQRHIEENLALGREEIDRERVQRAARAVQADRFIARLPQGYATEVRERGTNLSAGQRQLLSFARALAHGADVLVLDEATSAIDSETEALVQEGIHVLMEGKTALVIAHRLSTIQDADCIHVLHKGQLVESGTHEELIARAGVYERLYRLQYADQLPPVAAAGA